MQDRTYHNKCFPGQMLNQTAVVEKKNIELGRIRKFVYKFRPEYLQTHVTAWMDQDQFSDGEVVFN